MVYIQNGVYYPTIKENGIMSFSGKWVELEVIRLSEISQTEKDQYWSRVFKKIIGM
jgi:hypothetical protein